MATYTPAKVQKEQELIRVQQTPLPPFALQSHFYYRSDFFVAAARADVATLLETFVEEWPRRRDAGHAAVEWNQPEDEDDGKPVAGPSNTAQDEDSEDELEEEPEASPEVGGHNLRKRKAKPAPAPKRKKGTKPKFIAPAGLDSDVDENKLIDVKPETRQLADYRDLPPDPGPSPFAVFQEIWSRLGWSRVHLSVVHLTNRPDWFDVLTRIMLGALGLARPAVFALYTFWASQPDELEQRYIRIDAMTLAKLDATPSDCASAVNGAVLDGDLLPSHDLHLAVEQLHRGAPYTPAGRSNENVSAASGFFLIPTPLFNHPKLPSNYTIDGKERVRAKAAESVLAAREELEAIISGPRSSELRVIQKVLGVKIGSAEEPGVRDQTKLQWDDVLERVPEAVREDVKSSREIALETFVGKAPLNEDILTRMKAMVGRGQALQTISKVLDRDLDPQTKTGEDGLPLAFRLLDDHDAMRDFTAIDQGPDS